MFKNIPEQTLAKFCGLYSGIVLGIFWIPIRALERSGFEGMWATTLFNGASLLVILPVILYYWRNFFHLRWKFHLACFGVGTAYTLYASAFIYTEVVTALVMFYMMPIWGFLFARIIIKDPITPLRWTSMIVAFTGLWIILGKESGVPIPRNIGDWMALSAGLIWSGVALMLLADKEENPANYTAGFIGWAFINCLISALIAVHLGYSAAPNWSALQGVAIWLLPFAAIIIIPAAFATVYAPTKLNPGIVGLLFMCEISVASITAALWAGEPFGLRQILGVIMITTGGILETVWLYFRSRSRVIA